MKNRIKQSFACRNVSIHHVDTSIAGTHVPKMGEVAIFSVILPNGNYLVDPAGIHRSLFEGDQIMLAFGNRYATSQLEGYVPEGPCTLCHLIGRGGVAGTLKSINTTGKSQPAELVLVGYAVDREGKVINTIQKEKLSVFNPQTINSKVILSIGSSMDSGKTTSAAFLCGGFRAAGHTSAYIKLTGTAFPKDARYVYDRGADFITDFTHFGYPSTYLCEHSEILDLYQSLVNIAEEAVSPDYIVVEIADGIMQKETWKLLTDSQFMSSVHSVLFSGCDSLSVLAGLSTLEGINIRPFAVSGLFTASELLIQEVQGQQYQTEVLRLSDMLQGTGLRLIEKNAVYRRMSSMMEVA